jgi:hypothetical protein
MSTAQTPAPLAALAVTESECLQKVALKGVEVLHMMQLFALKYMEHSPLEA